MSKIIASAAIRGAHKIVERAKNKWKEAVDRWGLNEPVGFPNTAYYLPIIYGILGIPVEKLGDMEQVLKICERLLPPPVKERVHLPYLAPALDAGMATFFAEEIIEAIRYLEDPDFYTKTEEPNEKTIWLGAADDIILRKRGIEFVDGTAPGFAAILGSVPDNETAVKIARELQQKNLYVFMAAEHEGKRFAEQLVEEGVDIGWPTRLVSFGPDITAAVFAIGFATRVAMSFGGIQPGDFRKILIYNKDRTFAFVMALGHVTEEWYANAAGAINWGFPTIADTPIPQILPTGICTYEHVVSNVPHDQIVSKSIEVRGLKVTITEVPVPVPYAPAFEGERVRRDELYFESGGGKSHACEFLRMRDMREVEDGKIEVIGPDLDDIPEGSLRPLAIVVDVAGRRMKEEFEPILERQIHDFINYAHGVMHMGQRDIAWIRISKAAKEAGFRLKHLGDIIHARLHQDFGQIIDKVQVTIYSEEDKVNEILEMARPVYRARDERIEGMRDEEVDTFYSCTLCVPKGELILLPDGSFKRVERLFDEGSDDFVLSLNGDKFQPRRIEELFLNPTRQIYRITLSNGNRLSLTYNHKVLVDRPEGLVWIEASNLKPGDWLVSPSITRIAAQEKVPYLVDLLPADMKVSDVGFLMRLRDKVLGRYGSPAKASRELGVPYNRLYSALYFGRADLRSHHRLTLEELKGICEKVGWNWDEAKGEICEFSGEKGLGYRLNKLTLDEEIMYLAGLVASDGCVVRRGKGTFVQFTNSEPALIEEFDRIQMELFGTKCERTELEPRESLSDTLRIVGRRPITVLHVHNPIIGKLMLGLGIGSGGEDEGKWNGEFISTLPPSLVAAFLRGLFDGDGHVTDKHICISCGRYREAQNILLLLKKLGISTYISETTRGYQVCTRSGRDFLTFREIISSRHPEKRRKMMETQIPFDDNHVSRTERLPLMCGSILKRLIDRYDVEVTKLPVDYKTLRAWISGESPISKEKMGIVLDELREKVNGEDEDYRELLRWTNSPISFEKVRKVEPVEYNEDVVYNFSVEQTHNYLVNGVVVKNCQSFAPNHVCIVTPERTGLCGAYNILDCQASYEINPTGPNQPVPKGDLIDAKLGQWKGVNEFVRKASRGAVERVSIYSLMVDPMTTCGCCECIAVVLPLCNGFMTVNREFQDMTPCGMKFTTLAGTVGGGQQTPGFLGHSKYNITQRKFMAAEGGILRLVWMPKMLKEEIWERLVKRCEEIGVPDLVDKIADETIAQTEEEVLEFMQKVGHPALEMEPIL